MKNAKNNPQCNSPWRAAFQELKFFLMRDFQDYRREDYLQLSAISRRLLLLLMIPLILLLVLFLWRYFLGDDLLKGYDQDIARLMLQTQEMRSNIHDYQQFIDYGFVQEVSNDGLLINHDQDGLSESALIQQVESLAFSEDMTILSLKPYKRLMTLNQTSRRSKRSQQHVGSHTMESLIPRLEMISQGEVLGYLRSQSLENMTSSVQIPLLELELWVCTNTANVLVFLESIEQSLLQDSLLFYVKKMQIREGSNLCSLQEYQLLLQFYDLESLHQLYQMISAKEGNGELLQYPSSLQAIQRYMPLFEHRREQVDQGFVNSDRDLMSLQQLFLPTEMALSEKRLDTVLSDHRDLHYWYIGERYQEMLLLGIVLRGSRSFAILKQGKSHWNSLSLTDTHVVEMANNYIVVWKDEWEVNDERRDDFKVRHK